jgi:P-type E1-E2 ATPase
MTLDAIAPDDLLLVRSGETVPADGTLEDAGATLDESMLTGEPLPVSLAQGARLRSGAVNVGGAFRMRASAGAAGSTLCRHHPADPSRVAISRAAGAAC